MLTAMAARLPNGNNRVAETFQSSENYNGRNNTT
jgi:hypothetical protein